MWIPILISCLAVWASTSLFSGLSLSFYAVIGVALVTSYIHLQIGRHWAEVSVATLGASITVALLVYALDVTLIATYVGSATRNLHLLVCWALVFVFGYAARTEPLIR